MSDDMRSALNAMHAEGRGVYRLEFWNVATFIALGLNGDNDRFSIMLDWLGEFADAAMQPDRSIRPICLTCDYRFSRKSGPKLIAAFSAYADDADTYMMTGICKRCAALVEAELQERCMQALGTYLHAKVRQLNVHGTAGRA